MKIKKLFGALFIDLSKAFDTIDHDILLHKMEHYGIRSRCLDWVRDYLTNRKIKVKINSNGNVCTSKEEFINIVTPQGSNLGPLFFSIFVNEIFFNIGSLYMNPRMINARCTEKMKQPHGRMSTEWVPPHHFLRI